MLILKTDCFFVMQSVLFFKMNIMQRFFLLLTVCFLFSSFANSQIGNKFCGTDEIALEIYNDNPSLQALMVQKRNELKEFTINYSQKVNVARSNDSLLIIPVVFHVIHNYGNENISDAQVESAVQVLNRNFRRQHPDTGNIESIYKPITADCELEFRLARKDPSGNCTNGINRIASPLTTLGNHSVKDLIHWDPTKYLNIYVVKQIPNLAGYCLMPDQAAAKPEWDGVVISHQYTGNIGTANEMRSVTLSHEVGHFFNLYHIWGGNNVPGYYYLPVGQQSNCGESDEVADTPPTIGWSSCASTNASCGNVVDNYQNMMDYSYCNIMFTEGQKQRMRACLHSSVAHRNNLISMANLYATGVINPDTLCVAIAKASKVYACVGDTISFFDASLFNADTWEWNFGDGTIVNDTNPKYAYFTEGEMSVVLKVAKNGVWLQSNPLKISVSNFVPQETFVQDFEQIGNIENSELILLNENKNTQLNLFQSVGFKSLKCAGVLLNDTLHFSGKNSMVSPTINLENTPNAKLNFTYSFSQKKWNNNDALEVFFSNDCGKTWSSVLKRTSANFRTINAEIQNSNSLPMDSSQWKVIEVAVPSSFQVEDFRFKIDFTNYYGNNFFIDNININPELYTSAQEITRDFFRFFPNPLSEKIRIESSLENFNIKITDVAGKEMMHSEAYRNTTLDVSNLSSGMYFISVFNETKKMVKRFNKL